MLSSNKPYIIAESAFHHEGDLDFLLNWIDAAKTAGAHAVKFHLLFDIDDYMTKSHKGYESLKSIMIDPKHWASVFDIAEENGLDIIALTNDVASLEWVNAQRPNISAIELHATGINDLLLLEKAKNFTNTVILGTGGSTIDEIYFAVDYLRLNNQNDIFLMHGFQNYPTDPASINLKRMAAIQRIFDLPMGYADHTDPQDKDNALISCSAISSGFNVIEKHLTTAPGANRIDSHAAISEEVFEEVVRISELLWKIRGLNDFEFSDAEKKYGDTGPMKKAIVTAKEIKKGQQIRKEDISFKRTNAHSLISQKEILKVIGATAKSDIPKESLIDLSQIEYEQRIHDFSFFDDTDKD